MIDEYATKIIDLAKKHGADSAQVMVTKQYNVGTRFGENHITQNVSTSKTEFSLKTRIGEKMGNFTGSYLDDELETQIQQALKLTKLSDPDPDYPGFIEEQPDYPESSGTYAEREPGEIAEVIDQIIDVARNTDSRIETVAGNLHFISTKQHYLNSFDVEAEDEGHIISGVINVAANENGESRSTRRLGSQDINELDTETEAQSVAERAIMGLNPNEIDPGKYTALLDEGAMSALASFVARGASSEGIVTHNSYLKDKVGEQIFDESLTFVDETENTNHISSKIFDSEGVPSPNITFIEDGVLKEYAYNRRNANKLGVESNGRNITGFGGEVPMFATQTIKSGNRSREKLIESIDEGVLITNLFYNNFVNQPEGLCTGLTRDGLFKIEDGEIVSSLKNMRWTDNILSIFESAEPAKTQKQVKGFFFGSIITPPILVNEFNFSSKGKH